MIYIWSNYFLFRSQFQVLTVSLLNFAFFSWLCSVVVTMSYYDTENHTENKCNTENWISKRWCNTEKLKFKK